MIKIKISRRGKYDTPDDFALIEGNPAGLAVNLDGQHLLPVLRLAHEADHGRVVPAVPRLVARPSTRQTFYSSQLKEC